MGKGKNRWFGKGKGDAQPDAVTTQVEQDIERRAQRAEAVARQKVDQVIKQRVNEFVEHGIDKEVKKVVGIIDQALSRANASMSISLLALQIVTEFTKTRYVQRALTPAVPPKPPKNEG